MIAGRPAGQASLLAQHAGLVLQRDHGGGHQSLLAQHAGHLAILFAWIAIFGLVVARQKLRSLHLVVRALRPGPSSSLMAAGLVLAAGANWVILAVHADSGAGRLALVLLSSVQLLIAAAVALRPSELLVRGVGTACLAIALWWVLSRGLAAPGTELTMTDVLAFWAQLATAGFGWLTLAKAPVLSY